jgi:pyruvate/2-oxoglutarate dehydrogenase complex dihydrolipoamide acyltransferase (E2) component
VRLIYDHRLMDGATVARALMQMEEILNGPIARELKEARPRAEAA